MDIVYHAPKLGKTNSPEDFTSLLTDVTERRHLGEWRERGW